MTLWEALHCLKEENIKTIRYTLASTIASWFFFWTEAGQELDALIWELKVFEDICDVLLIDRQQAGEE